MKLNFKFSLAFCNRLYKVDFVHMQYDSLDLCVEYSIMRIPVVLLDHVFNDATTRPGFIFQRKTVALSDTCQRSTSTPTQCKRISFCAIGCTAMISVRYSDVPEYLPRSELFRTFDEDDDLQRSVPSGCFKKDTIIDSDESFMHIRRTMQYWIVHEPPREVLCCVLAYDVESFRNSKPVLWRLFHTFQFAPAFIELSTAEPHRRMDLAITNQMKSYILTDLHTLGHRLPNKAFTLAAKYNNIIALNFARALECDVTERSAYYCSMHGNLEFLEYLHSREVPFSSGCVAAAAKRGHLLCLEYFHSLALPFGADALCNAAESGCLDCLRFVLQRGVPMDPRAVVTTARSRDVACLQYLVEYGAPMTGDVPVAACEEGRLECLHYAI